MASDINVRCGAQDPNSFGKCELPYGHSDDRHWDASLNIGWANNPESVPGGANRAPMPVDYSQLSHIALRLMAETQHEGNITHGVGNWQKGLPASNLVTHALTHILKLINGDVSENHLGHALWNLEKLAHFIETRPDLIDIIPLRKALGLDNPAATPQPVFGAPQTVVMQPPLAGKPVSRDTPLEGVRSDDNITLPRCKACGMLKPTKIETGGCIRGKAHDFGDE